MDMSKGAVPSNVHRTLTHQSWFLSTVLERVKFANSVESPDNRFYTIRNSNGKEISVRDIGEQHILEDFRGKFIPTAQDYLCETELKPWMQNGGGENDFPPSYSNIINKKSIAKLEEAMASSEGRVLVCDGDSKNWQPVKIIELSGDHPMANIVLDGASLNREKPFQIDIKDKINPVYRTD